MTLDLPPSLWPTVHLLATGEPWPPSSDAAADRFVTRANKEALLPLLFADDGLPAVVGLALDRVRALERINARRSDILLAAMRRVGEILRDEPVVFLKGADYRHRLYPQPVLRPMQDIDVLVPRARMPAVTRMLLAGGLSLVPMGAVTELPSHHERLFRLGNVSVDVHHSFIQRSRNRVDYEALWNRKVPFAAPGGGAYRLADADALVYHALSMAADEFSIPLLRYLDLWLMMRAAPEIGEAAAERAREWGAARALHGTFRLASRLFPEFEALGVGHVTERLLGPSARRFLDGRVLPDPWEHGDGRTPARVTRLWRKLWLMDGFGRRGAFALYHVYALGRGQVLSARRRLRRIPGSPTNAEAGPGAGEPERHGVGARSRGAE